MGTLYVVATPIGNLGDMTPRAVETLRSVALIAAEDTRHTAGLLRAFDIQTPTISYHHHNRAARADRLLAALATGDVAIVSDAGTPAIADPGHELVAAAIANGHVVVPIPGASSVLAAVVGSGIVPGPFTFIGFLPRAGDERAVAIGRTLSLPYPVIFFESPLRTIDTLRDLEAIAPDREVVVARELTKLHEEFIRGQVGDVISQLEQVPPRGEIVIVVGAGEGEAGGGGEAETLARSLLSQGMKPSKVAREIAAASGIDSAEAYGLVQRVRGAPESS